MGLNMSVIVKTVSSIFGKIRIRDRGIQSDLPWRVLAEASSQSGRRFLVLPLGLIPFTVTTPESNLPHLSPNKQFITSSLHIYILFFFISVARISGVIKVKRGGRGVVGAILPEKKSPLSKNIASHFWFFTTQGAAVNWGDNHTDFMYEEWKNYFKQQCQPQQPPL